MLFSTAYKVRVGRLFSTDACSRLFSTTYKVRVFRLNACQELSETVNNAAPDSKPIVSHSRAVRALKHRCGYAQRHARIVDWAEWGRQGGRGPAGLHAQERGARATDPWA